MPFEQKMPNECAEINQIVAEFRAALGPAAKIWEKHPELENVLTRTLAEKLEIKIFNEKFLKICANCKKIDKKNGKWIRIEQYIVENSEANFSHGICPDCVKKLYPELDLFDNEREN